MKRLFVLLMILVLSLSMSVLAEEATLRGADTVEAVNSFIDLPDADAVPAVQAGRIRFVSLNAKDSAFRQDFWQNSQYNLMDKGSYRADYRNMHDRAAYCMALSYLGIEMTPAMMSELAGSRDVTAPFAAVTAKVEGLELMEYKAYYFDTAVENYLNDPSYSPLVVKIRRPDGGLHTVMVVGYIPSTGGFIICDPAAPAKDGTNLHAYKMAWHVVRQVVLASDFWDMFYASDVEALYQWHLETK